MSSVHRYAVIGNPIAQSRSPEIHQRFACAAGIDLQYERLLAPLDGFIEAVEAFRDGGGLGLNVTAPFKIEAYANAHRSSDSARIAGAANALRFHSDGCVEADNFDGAGLVRDITVNHGIPLQGKHILLIGAGGAARGILLPFLRENPAALHIANRSQTALTRLLQIATEYEVAILSQTHNQAQFSQGIGHSPVKGHLLEALSSTGLAQSHHNSPLQFDIIINCTSIALHSDHGGDALPLDASLFAHCQLACELSYGHGLTPFLRQARQNGAQHCIDGTGMLVEQAALAFHWWHGVLPDTAPVITELLAQLPAI